MPFYSIRQKLVPNFRILFKGPPGEPTLNVRLDNEPLHPLKDVATVHAGQTVQLSCAAQGGNPAPILTINRNGESFGLGPTPFENTLQFVATAIDNGASMSCSAHNAAVDRPIDSRTIKLNVLSKLKKGLHAFL